MKKFIFILITSVLFLTGCGDKSDDNYNNQKASYNTERLSTSNKNSNTPDEPKEEVLSTFSTKISQKDPDRQNNITLACTYTTFIFFLQYFGTG